MRLEKIRLLNDQAQTAQAKLEAHPETRELPFETPVDFSRFWLPESLTHLAHLPVYAEFTREEKLTYNQTFALMVIEQSILFEDQLSGFMKKVFQASPKIREKYPDLFQEGVDHFLREEEEHTALFWRLAHASDASYQGQKKFRYYQPRLLDKLATLLVLSFPKWGIVWSWLSLYGEEKFLLNYKEIKRASHDPATAIDPLHDAVHYWHMLDEARHVQMDEIFIEECWDPAPKWLKRINLKILEKIYQSFVVRSNSAWSLWKIACKKHPSLLRHSAKVKEQLRSLGSTASYQQIVSARSSIPRTSALFDARPEFAHFGKILPGYQRRHAHLVP